jgi:ElaB/YqjD/DUF883 family membrane-anchored ribosome-binding protein
MNGNMSGVEAGVKETAHHEAGEIMGRMQTEPLSVREEFNRLAADVEDLVRKIAHVTDADVARVRKRVEEKLADTRRIVEQGAARVRADGRQLIDATDGYVHERPWTALGIAAAIGILIGVLSARR